MANKKNINKDNLKRLQSNFGGPTLPLRVDKLKISRKNAFFFTKQSSYLVREQVFFDKNQVCAILSVFKNGQFSYPRIGITFAPHPSVEFKSLYPV